MNISNLPQTHSPAVEKGAEEGPRRTGVLSSVQERSKGKQYVNTSPEIAKA